MQVACLYYRTMCAVLVMAVAIMLAPSGSYAAINARTNPDCTLVSRTCVDHAARLIAGQWVSRPCWRWRDQYNCAGPVVDTCQQYVNRGCAQIGSVCNSRLPSGACQTLMQTYRCLAQAGNSFNNCTPWINRGCSRTASNIASRSAGGGITYNNTYRCLDRRGAAFDHCTPYTHRGCTLTASTTTPQPPNGTTTRNTYKCQDYKGSAFDNCRQLTAQGCKQIGSSCIFHKPSGACATFDKTFQCLTKKGTTTTKQLCGNAAMCVDGSCFKTNAPPGNDFAAVVSRFAALTAAGASVNASGGVSIFKGSPEHCNSTIFGAKNCCTASPSGWGKGIVKGCPASAKKLAQARQAGLAIYIGTFCANKAFFGACLRKQEVWCAFPSKLARIVQKQGRLQLGIGWGSAQSPNCRGFTPQEMQRLDFSRMDLSEFYADVMARMTPMDANTLGNRISTRVKNYFNRGAPNGGRLAP